MIKCLQIKKLYERFDYTLSFDERNVTILTGPNGYGKTTILNIIDYIYNRNFTEIFNINFDEIEFEIIDGTKITIKSKKSGLEINDIFIHQNSLDDLSKTLNTIETYNCSNKEYNFIMLKKLKNINDRLINGYENGYEIEECIKSKSEFLKEERFINLEKDLFNKLSNEYSESKYNCDYKHKVKSMIRLVKDLDNLKNHLGEIYFIKEQRLLSKTPPQISTASKTSVYTLKSFHKDSIEVINTLSNKFKKIIDKTSNEYSAQANKLDSTYPIRLFDMKKGITEHEYKQKIEEIGKKFEKLKKYDISDMQNIEPRLMFKEEHSKALKVYFDDFDIKYRVYEDLIRQLDLFVGIINNRLQFKKIKIDRHSGIKVIDDSDVNCIRDIKLENLSSGEKQEIVLFFELIFASKQNSLILIDEPEISLHIAWQKRFMQDVIDIANERDLKVIVATHSPQIIGKYRDAQIDLGELYAEKQ